MQWNILSFGGFQTGTPFFIYMCVHLYSYHEKMGCVLVGVASQSSSEKTKTKKQLKNAIPKLVVETSPWYSGHQCEPVWPSGKALGW